MRATLFEHARTTRIIMAFGFMYVFHAGSSLAAESEHSKSSAEAAELFTPDIVVSATRTPTSLGSLN